MRDIDPNDLLVQIGQSIGAAIAVIKALVILCLMGVGAYIFLWLGGAYR